MKNKLKTRRMNCENNTQKKIESSSEKIEKKYTNLIETSLEKK